MLNLKCGQNADMNCIIESITKILQSFFHCQINIETFSTLAEYGKFNMHA